MKLEEQFKGVTGRRIFNQVAQCIRGVITEDNPSTSAELLEEHLYDFLSVTTAASPEQKLQAAELFKTAMLGCWGNPTSSTR